ncbi:MAG TPA: Ig-like domain-containing protein, partial [Microvirga sp.]|nr:Ig-like domain-containing protein [Microvirga sp.]
MAMGPGAAPINTVPDATTIGLVFGAPYVFATPLEVSDADGTEERLTVRLTVNEGALEFASDFAGVEVYGYPAEGSEEGADVARDVTLVGLAADINRVLETLTYRAPAAPLEASPSYRLLDELVIRTSDGIRSDTDVLNFRVSADGETGNAAPVNDVPTGTTTLGIDRIHDFGSTVQVSDDGSGDGGLTVTLSVEWGELLFAVDPEDLPPGLDSIEFFPGSEGPDYWELTGSAAGINQALLGLQYRPTMMPYEGFDAVSISTSDGEFQDDDLIPFNVVHSLDVAPASVPYGDSPGDDTFVPTDGTLTTSVWSPLFSLPDGTSVEDEAFDLEQIGQYGTLRLNSQTGAYRYVPNDDAIERLKGTESETFNLAVFEDIRTIGSYEGYEGDWEPVSTPAATQVLTIVVAGANDRPVAGAEDLVYSMAEGRLLTVAAGSGVLAHATDRDDDTLAASLLAGPSHGTLTLRPNGSFDYKPDAGFSGVDSFTVAADDGNLTSTPIRVTVNVPAGKAPAAADDAASVTEDRFSLAAQVASGNVLANDSPVAPSAPASSLPALLVTALEGSPSAVGQPLQGRFGTLT